MSRRPLCFLVPFLLLLNDDEATAFRSSYQIRSESRKQIRRAKKSSLPRMQALPTTTSETISYMTKATQAALQSRCSRMDVELPPGALLGVEAGGQKKGSTGLFGLSMPAALSNIGDLAGQNQQQQTSVTTEEGLLSLQRGDRELARLYTEMFRPIGEAVTVAFGNDVDAAAAKKLWGSSTRVVSLEVGSRVAKSGGQENQFQDFDAAARATKSQKEAWSGMGKKKSSGKSKVGSRKGSKGGRGGFAAKMKAATAKVDRGAASSGSSRLIGGIVPEDTEVLVVVAPKGEQELSRVEAISREAGLGCCIVLLNARLEAAKYASTTQRDYFLSTFEPVFQLKPPPPAAIAEAKERNGGADVVTPIVSRAFPQDWKLSCQPAGIGKATRELASFKERPSMDELAASLAEAGVHGSEMPGGLESQLGALFGNIKSFVENQ